MDTDDLSSKSYKAIIIEAQKFSHDLTLQFGVMASSCKNELEYLQKEKKLIPAIRGYNDYQLSDMFFGSLPNKKLLHSALEKILENISSLENIPEDKRQYDF